jgi:4-alpha-glucanotransferase
MASNGQEVHWDMIRLALGSVGHLAIVPLQDVLGLGEEARMNYPGRPEGNWQWRYVADLLTSKRAGRLRELTEIYGRLPLYDK